jgi:hypothetical protein
MEQTQEDLNQLATRRINQFNRRLWTEDEMAEWYFIDFNDAATKRLVCQASWFAGTEDRPTNLRDQDYYDHWHLEVFLQRRNLMAIREAAAQLSMSVDEFRRVATALTTSPVVEAIGTPWTDYSNSVVRSDYLRSFHLAFPRLKRTIFQDHPAYIECVHREILDTLQIRIETTIDRADVKLGTNPPRPGYYVDFITGEPVGLGHEISLSTRKPLELAPDLCSWITYANLTIPDLESKFHRRSGISELILGQLRAADVF